MAYMTITAPCFVCGRLFQSNPDHVPSFDNQPICPSCMAAVNRRRAEMGLDPHFVHPLAYEPQEVP